MNACKTFEEMVIYADDTSETIAEEELQLSVIKANVAAEEFSLWCTNNGLLINTKKTVFMVSQPKNVTYDFSPLIKVNHASIEQVDHFKYLGVTVDQKLTWEIHIQNLVNKISGLCFVIRRFRGTVSLGVLSLTYFGLVQSLLSYGLACWGSSAHMNKVFIMQKKVIRCIVGLGPRDSCKTFFASLSILTLPSLYIYTISTNIKKNEEMQLKNNMIHNHNTRRANELRLPFSRLSVGQGALSYQGIICYNKALRLFGHIQNFNRFKNSLYKFLMENAFYSVEEYLEF